jgi:hypothetical protein
MNNSEKRRAGRIVENLDAEIISGGKSYKGLVMNFSESGMYMVTATADSVVDIAPSTLIDLKCSLVPDKNISLTCEVKWFQPRTSSHGVSFSMGMEILDPPGEYIKFIEDMN